MKDTKVKRNISEQETNKQKKKPNTIYKIMKKTLTTNNFSFSLYITKFQNLPNSSEWQLI